MIPMKHSTIFKSRYWAMLWAAGIIWFAIDTAGAGTTSTDNASDNATENSSGVTDATGAPVDNQQLKQLKSAIDGL